MNFMLPVPEASLPAVEICSDNSVAGQMISIAEKDGEKIKSLRKDALERHLNWEYYPTDWKVDTTKSSVLNFKGFQADTIMSEITGFSRLKYNRELPFEKEVQYLDYFIPSDSVKIPDSYIIKKQWTNVVDLLKANQISNPFSIDIGDILIIIDKNLAQEFYKKPKKPKKDIADTKSLFLASSISIKK